MDDDDRRRIDRMWELLPQLFATLEENIREVTALYEEKALFEPPTLRTLLDSRPADRAVDSSFRPLLEELACLLPPPDRQDFPWFPPAQDLFHFVDGVRTVPPVERVNGLLEAQLTTDTRVVFRAQLVEAMKQSRTLAFERRVRVAGDVLRNVSERWYKPILGLTLTLAHEAYGSPRHVPTGDLGVLENACLNNQIIPSSIVQERLRLIRNSGAHSHTEFHVDDTVTFFNVTRQGVRESVGPWSWDEVVGFIESCLVHFWTLRLVFVRQLRMNSVKK